MSQLASGITTRHSTLIYNGILHRLFALQLSAPLKWFALVVFLLNLRSAPLVWHFRVFWKAIKLRIQYRLFRISVSFRSAPEKRRLLNAWIDSILPVGADPFNYTVTYNTWASLDDCDFNFHLSNSSYSKTLDCARAKAALTMFPRYMRAGGRIALAGTHFSFVREIPMLANYEVRVSLATWDEKWVYVLARFVSKGGKKGKKGHPSMSGAVQSALQATPPTPGDSTPHSDGVVDVVKLTKSMLPVDSDGATLHCIAVSVVCFKMNRITIPPALVLASSGFVASGTASTSKAPPHWAAVQNLSHIDDARPFIKLLKGGWRDVPSENRWWDKALEGTESTRKERLQAFRQLRDGLEFAKTIV